MKLNQNPPFPFPITQEPDKSRITEVELDFRNHSDVTQYYQRLQDLQDLPNLKSLKLDLSKTSVGNTGIETLMEVIKSSVKLETLELRFDGDSRHSAISDDGMLSIAQFLKTTPNLKSLSLSFHNERYIHPASDEYLIGNHCIGDKGFCALVESLKGLGNLQELYLGLSSDMKERSGNHQVSDIGVQAFIDVLGGLSDMRALEIYFDRNCKISKGMREELEKKNEKYGYYYPMILWR